MNRPTVLSWMPSKCIPRTRGDEPAAKRKLEAIENVFPAPAGMNQYFPLYCKGTEVFPAPAGMNRLCARSVAPSCGIPRTRGDEPIVATLKSNHATYSPHPRG